MSDFVVALAAAFLIASLAVVLSSQFRLPRATVLIGAGFLVGLAPVPLGTIEDLAKFSGLFLIFAAASRSIPMELTGDILSDSLSSAAIRTALLWVLGAGIGSAVGLDGFQAMFLGFAAAATSTAEAVGLIEKKAERRMVHARLAESASLAEDVIAVCFLGFLASDFIGSAAAFLIIVFSLTLRTKSSSFLEYLEGSEELQVFCVVALVVASSFVSEMIGAGIAAGALAGGLMLSNYPADVEVLESFRPVETFFTSLFFVSLGAIANISALGLAGGVLLGVLVSVIGPLITFSSLLMLGRNKEQSLMTAVEIGSISELVLVGSLLFRPSLGSIFTVIVVGSAVSSAVSFTLSYRSESLEGLADLFMDGKSTEPVEETGHEIIVGYGRLGRRLVNSLENPVVVESDPQRIEKVQSCPKVFGDAKRTQVLEAANISNAEALISTPESDRIAETLKQIDTDAAVHAFVESQEMAKRLEFETAATRKGLAKKPALETLREGFENDFSSLRTDLKQDLESRQEES